MFKRAMIIAAVFFSVFSIFADSSAFTDDYLLVGDIPITYGDESFRNRILERTHGERDPIGLVLSGGSARALAHLGVLEYLEENGIVPDFIISNSMGSIVALLYAAGLEPDQIIDFLEVGELSSYFNISLPIRGGILSAGGFESLVSSVVGPDLRIEDLEIPVMVICDDLVTEREVRIAEGPFIDVFMASFAMPVYFSPVIYEGHLLVDGGVKSLVPINAAYDYTDTVIVSTTFYDLDTLNLINPITILNRTFDIGKRQRASYETKGKDFIWIRCGVEQFSFMDFGAAAEMKEIGYQSAKEEEEKLSKLFKTGSANFSENRKKYAESISKARRNLYYFGRIEASTPTNILTIGAKNHQSKDTYLNESTLIGIQYEFLYSMIDINATAGWAFNSHTGSYCYNAPAVDLGFNFYPLHSLKFTLEASAAWYGWQWLPNIYAHQSLEWKAFAEDFLSISVFESVEGNYSSTGESYLVDSGVKGEFSSGIFNGRFNLSYMLIKSLNELNFGHFINLASDNRITLPLSFFIDFGLTERVRVDGKRNVPLYFADGFESSFIDPVYGYENGDNYTTSVIRISSGYRFADGTTIGEFLIINDSEISAYFDMLLSDLEFYYSTGVEMQTKLSLIGLVDLPLRLRLGYNSLSGTFTGSLLFSTSY